MVVWERHKKPPKSEVRCTIATPRLLWGFAKHSRQMAQPLFRRFAFDQFLVVLSQSKANPFNDLLFQVVATTGLDCTPHSGNHQRIVAAKRLRQRGGVAE